MTRIAVFGDIHDEQARLGAALDLLDGPPFDLALLAGDLGLDPPWEAPARQTGRGPHDESVRRTVGRVAGRLGCPVLFVPGNHDLRDAVRDLDGVNCDRAIVAAAGLRVAGLGGAGPTRFGFPYEWTEGEIDAALAQLLPEGAKPVEILLTHTPPFETGLDRTYHGAHVGSPAVRDRIGRARPGLVVCGHIHEAWGVERVEGVPCLNAGALGQPCAQVIVWIVDWKGAGPARVEHRRIDEQGPAESRVWQV